MLSCSGSGAGMSAMPTRAGRDRQEPVCREVRTARLRTAKGTRVGPPTGGWTTMVRAATSRRWSLNEHVRSASDQPADHRSLVAHARAVARDHLEPIVRAGQPGRVNRRLVHALAEQGLLGRLYPAELGGAADGPVSAAVLCALREGIAAESPTAETTLAVQGLG